MAIDQLQDKIRKTKSMLMVDLTPMPDVIPPHYLEEKGNAVSAASAYCRDLMQAMKGMVPALRFHFGAFALMGDSGLGLLSELLRKADSMGYYTLLDAPQILSPAMAEYTAAAIFGQGKVYPCDGLVVSGFVGSDILKPFLPYCQDEKKDLFVVVRTSNKAASEIQDLLAGSRMVHVAAADYVNRLATDSGKYGYSRVAVLSAASSAESLRNLRTKYPRLFLLADGLDAPGANAKNCANAFDKMGHGAVVCVGSAVTAAWKKEEASDADCVASVVSAVQRYVKNLSRYITVL